MTIEIYPNHVLEYIEAYQKSKLFIRLGHDYEKRLSEVITPLDFISEQIDKELNSEFGTDSDPRYEIEAQMLTYLHNPTLNRTKYELFEHKYLVNQAEFNFRKYCIPKFKFKVPYNATLISNDINAEIVFHEALDKPIIFFHGKLFSANAFFCKLYAKLLSQAPSSDARFSSSTWYIDKSQQNLKELFLVCAYFYNYFISESSNSIHVYKLKEDGQNIALATLLESITLFIYSHEVGHYHYQHVATGLAEWKAEYEADRFAMYCIGEFNRNSPSAYSWTYFGPIIFFRLLSLLEKHRPGLCDVETHPPAAIRMEKYVEWLKKYSIKDDLPLLEEYFSIEQQCFSIISEIFYKLSTVPPLNLQAD